jgi:hypothetical protein
MSVSNEGYYNLEGETIFRPHLPQGCSVVTEYYHMVLHWHALQAVQVSLTSFSNEEPFTPEDKTVFRLYLP